MLSSALVLLGAAVLVSTLFYYFKLPPIVGFIAAGVLVGPSGLGLVSTLPQVESLTEVAAVLLMFTIGLEFSFKELSHFRRPLLVLGLGQILITLIIFTVIFYFGFEMSIEKSVFISFLIAPSSTAVVFKLLSDHREFETPYGKAALGILLMQDLAIIPMLVVVPFLVANNSVAPTTFVDSLIPVLILIALVVTLLYLLSRYAVPFVFQKVAQTKNREIFFFSVVFICLALAALMHKVGLSLSLGAFLAGMLLAGSNYSKQAIAEVLPLRDTFLSLFFMAMGMMLDSAFVVRNILPILAIAVLVIAIKSTIIFAVVWLAGSTANVSRAATLLLFQFGEFAFILNEVGSKHGLLLEHEKQYFIAIAILSLALTPYLYTKIPMALQNEKYEPAYLKRFEGPFRKLRSHIQNVFAGPLDIEEFSSPQTLEDHVIVVGYGVAGQSLSRILKHLKIEFRVIEFNAETVRIHSGHTPLIYGDAASPEILKQANIHRARLVVVVTSGVHMLEPILQNVLRLNRKIKIVARTNYLLDLNRLPHEDNIKYIVSELESTLDVLDKTLSEFQIEKETIFKLTSALRDELRDFRPAQPSV